MKLEKQYQNSSRLNTRIHLHRQFSTNKYGWHKWVFNQFKLPAKAQVLELGCGNGSLWMSNNKLIPMDCNIVLSDFSPGMINDSRNSLGEVSKAFRFIVADAQNIPFKDKSFHVIIANHMLYHVRNLDKTLSEIMRIMKPNGYFYAATNGQNHMKELNEITQMLFPEFKPSQIAHSFTLENGKKKLSKWFSEVRVLNYDDSLVVTDARILSDYVLSMLDEVDESKEKELFDYMEKKIEFEGAIKITKQPGMFEAIKHC